MDSKTQKTEEALIDWFKNIHFISASIESFEELKSGVFLLEIFKYLDYNQEFVDQNAIIKDPGDDWSLQLQNLTTLKEALEKYYKSKTSSEANNILLKKDIEPIAILNDMSNDNLIYLVEIIIGAIMLNDKKNSFIEAIMELQNEEHQQNLAEIIQKVDIEESLRIKNNTHGDDISPLKQENYSMQDSNKSNKKQTIENEQAYLEKIDELENENNQLQAKNKELLTENQLNSEKLQEFTTILDKQEKELKKYQKEKMESLHTLGVEDLDDIQTEMVSKKARIKELEKFIEELQSQYQQEISELKDELRSQSMKMDQIKQLEKISELFHEKQEENQVLRKDVQLCEQNLEQAQKEIDEKQKKIDAQEQKITNFRGKLDREKSDGVGLQVELEKKMAQINQLKEQLNVLTNSDHEKADSIMRLNEQIELLKVEVKKNNSQDMSPDIESKYRNLNQNNLQAEISKGARVADFQEYLGTFANVLESPRYTNNSQDIGVPIKSQGSNEEIQTEEEEKSNKAQNNHNNSKSQNIDSQKSNRRSSNTQNNEEFEDIKHNNQILKDKMKELVIENEALKTTIQAQDSHSIKGTSDERQGLISSNETLSDLLKKKNQIIDNMSRQVHNYEYQLKQMKDDSQEVKNLRKNQALFKKQLEIVKQELNEQNKIKEEEIKLLVTTVYELQQKNIQS